MPHMTTHTRPLLNTKMPVWIGPLDTEPKLIADNSFFNHHDSIAVIDDIITESDCQTLLDLAENVVKLGDGYNGNNSPHNQNEKFYGATLSLVADKVKSGEVHISYLYTYYYLAERVRRQVQLWNGLENLFFGVGQKKIKKFFEDFLNLKKFDQPPPKPRLRPPSLPRRHRRHRRTNLPKRNLRLALLQQSPSHQPPLPPHPLRQLPHDHQRHLRPRPPSLHLARIFSYCLFRRQFCGRGFYYC